MNLAILKQRDKHVNIILSCIIVFMTDLISFQGGELKLDYMVTLAGPRMVAMKLRAEDNFIKIYVRFINI